jgi:hypothetical protein
MPPKILAWAALTGWVLSGVSSSGLGVAKASCQVARLLQLGRS